ncbi:MAG: type II toxin-antitoxin system PemK/MazF family toxin [Phycisphaerales bacterium]|nr:type II toxin-antitoxin system PemK/MazF family toxin [Phycisphaerales bacterium]
MPIEPKPGLVIRYDFLWKEEKQAGIEDGRKDRPCAIVLTMNEKQDGSKDVLLCAITHSPPAKNETAVEIPPKVARHLGLDHNRSWIKTDQINRLTWAKGRTPPGVTPARKGKWEFGMMPQALGKQMHNQVREKAKSRFLKTVERDERKGAQRAERLRQSIKKRERSKDEKDRGR